MESRVKLLGHPVHQMLIPLPAGLLIAAALLDILDVFIESRWIATVSFWNIALGLVFAVIAALFGIADFSKIPKKTRARRVGALHGLGNGAVVVLFAVAAYFRFNTFDYETDKVSLTLEIVALGLLAATAWLGGELVDRLGVGVDEGAHLNAPNSIRVKHLEQSRRSLP